MLRVMTTDSWNTNKGLAENGICKSGKRDVRIVGIFSTLGKFVVGVVGNLRK